MINGWYKSRTLLMLKPCSDQFLIKAPIASFHQHKRRAGDSIVTAFSTGSFFVIITNIGSDRWLAADKASHEIPLLNDRRTVADSLNLSTAQAWPGKEITVSEVKRYHVTEAGLVEGQSLGRINVVLGADHDRVTAERDALQLLLNQRDEQVESLEQQRESELRNGQDLQQRLTAADERADVLEQAMHALSALIGLPINGPQASQDALLTIIWDALGEEDAALKQADGGEGVTCTTCMDKKTIRGSGGKFPRDCPDCCNEEG